MQALATSRAGTVAACSGCMKGGKVNQHFQLPYKVIEPLHVTPGSDIYNEKKTK